MIDCVVWPPHWLCRLAYLTFTVFSRDALIRVAPLIPDRRP